MVLVVAEKSLHRVKDFFVPEVALLVRSLGVHEKLYEVTLSNESCGKEGGEHDTFGVMVFVVLPRNC